jgi:hypothetical protein
MFKKDEYPKRFHLKEIVAENLCEDKNLWLISRGFAPPEPKTYDTCLVIPLYCPEGRFLGNQLRDVNDDNVDTKYTLTNNIYDPKVKTTPDNIKGIQVICEGTLDSLLLRLKGVNAYTTLGLKAYRVKQAFEALEERTLFIFDNDMSGHHFSKKYTQKAMRYSVPQQYKDVCSFFEADKKGFHSWLSKLLTLTSYIK